MARIVPTNGLPAAGVRGGHHILGTAAGAFTVNFNHPPSFQYPTDFAARYCTGGR